MTEHDGRDRPTRSAEQTAFVGALCWHVPELLPTMQEHLDDSDGLSPNFLMAGITHRIVEGYRVQPESEPLKNAMEFIEEAFSRGLHGAQEIIRMSFLGSLPQQGEAGFDVRLALGPNLQGALEEANQFTGAVRETTQERREPILIRPLVPNDTSLSESTAVIDTYLNLLDELLGGWMTARQFQARYLKVYKNDMREMSRAAFEALDWLFGEVDDYTSDPELRQEAGGLDDDELLDRAREGKARLLRLINADPARKTSVAEQSAFTCALCWHTPELLPVMQESMDDFDELLSHLLMADISRWAVERVQNDFADDSLRQVLNFFEESFIRGSWHGAEEIISVSFLENLSVPGEDGFELIALLGPNLREQLKVIDPRYRSIEQ